MFDYDPETGVVSRKRPVQRGRLGPVAPKPREGWLRLRIRAENYQLHHVAWAIHHGEWPGGRLVFKNGDKSDTRLANLTPASASEAQYRAKLRSDNTSGAKGVSWHPTHRLWQASIGHDGQRTSLGWFREKDEAVAALALKRAELHGEFARHA